MSGQHCPTCTCEPPIAAPPAPSKPCEGFRWAGQSFRSCDRCGYPFWEHSHDERPRRDGSPFDPQSELVPITPEMAEACRRKWGPR